MMTLRRRPEIPTRILVTVLTMSERSGWVNPELVNFLANMADDRRSKFHRRPSRENRKRRPGS